MKSPTAAGIGLIFVGLLLIFAALFFETLHFNPLHPEPTFLGTCIKVLDVAGIGLLAIGVLNILIETRDWRNYFSKLLRDIVIEQSYLDALGSDKLTILQTNVFKALFRDHSIDREGGFLNYFRSNLHKYIAEPYREDVTSEISVVECDEKDWLVEDKVTYVCRKSAGKIQPNINWQVDENEYSGLESLVIEIQFPYDHEDRGKRVKLYEGAPKLGEELVLSLNEYAHIDGLIVTGIEKCKIAKSNFQYWSMAHPTRNFGLTVTYPVNCTIQVKPLVLNEKLLQITNRSTYYSAKYDSWMLPGSGIAYRIKQ